MEFSDDSFIWGDASNDSDTMDFHIKQEDSDNNKDNNLVEDRSHKQKNKAKKRKYEQLNELNGTIDRKPKVIKSEPDSDIDTPTKKKKKKHHNHNEEIQESDFDDSYLNYKVKQEQVSFLEPAPVKSKKKKKAKKNSESFSSEDLDSTSQEVDTDTPKPIEGSQIDDKSNTFEEEVVEKKKKKKSKKKSSDTYVLNDDFENSDENFQAKKKIKRKKSEVEINSNSFDRSEDSQIEEISCINNSALNNNFIDDDQIKENSKGDLKSESTKIDLNIDHSVSSKNKPTKQVPKILERLRFEDEDSIDSVPKENDDETNLSKHLRSFFKVNKNLSLITPKAQAESAITEDDEIWIINGPHELNVKDFKGIRIKLDTKCKLKFNGQSYDSIIDNCITKAPILSLKKNKLFVKNVPVNYSINLRKRIPKAHIPEENVMVNNQINFIPLPETKCRHPLFGINYKKATKISPSINERLKNTVTELSNKEKRKKHKKEKRKVEIESEVETKPQIETIPIIPVKKKRKRKSSMKDEHVAKKAKYIKNEPDSTDVWDSEQAIEKNLFDF